MTLCAVRSKETIVRKAIGVLVLLPLWLNSAQGADHAVSIGDDCDTNPGQPSACFSPLTQIIAVGDSVTFSSYADFVNTGPHNVVADDGSFRCALGCDGKGGDGTPRDPTSQWRFTLTFDKPGIVTYHDEASKAYGAIIVRASPAFAIGPGITGSWYDPDQSGHGLFIEVLPENRFLAAWFTFTPDGSAQSWFTGAGTYFEDTANVIDAELPTGGRWIPNFDPGQVTFNHWGTLHFYFSDCNHGWVLFDSVYGYGTSGGMKLTRLTQPLGLSCS
jgi:plastocyanin